MLKQTNQNAVALLGVFLVGGVAVIASIVRLYALWVYAVTDDPPYDDVFVSSKSAENMNILDYAYSQIDPLAFPNRSKCSHNICLRTRPPPPPQQSLRLVFPQPLRPIPSVLRTWGTKFQNVQSYRSYTFERTNGALLVRWRQQNE